jgi:hypothetical protein
MRRRGKFTKEEKAESVAKGEEWLKGEDMRRTRND